MTYLILRFSTLGNVAMLVPVLTSVAKHHPNDRFVVVARHRLADLFYGLDNVVFHQADWSKQSVGRLCHDLKTYSIDAVIDLQDTLRSHLVDYYFKLHRISVYTIAYGRTEKRMLTLRGYKHSEPLITQFDRYAATFRQAGLESDRTFTAIPVCEPAREQMVEQFGPKQGKWIGLAPFAAHESNTLPGRLVKEVISYCSKKGYRIYLFGAGRIECATLAQWAAVFPQVVSVAGTLSLAQELELMRMLDSMVCMDSANQHLSALVGLKTISIWCATHPAMGFAGWGQTPQNQIQLPIGCRPCTIHGCEKCRYKNFACKDIEVENIMDKIEN